MKLAELKKLATKHNIKGRSKMNKAQLEKALSRVRHSRKPVKKKSRKPVKKKSRKPVKKKSRKPVKKKSRKPVKKKFIIMCDYTDKSLVLLGSTYAHKEEIKKAGGKYNPNLSVGKGWVFPKTKKKAVEKLVKKMRSAPAKSRKAVKKSRKKKAKKSKFKFSACAEYVCEKPLLCRPGLGKHNVYNIRVENGDLVANRCNNDQKETLVEGYTTPDHTLHLEDLNNTEKARLEVKKGGKTVLTLYKAGNSSGKCRSVNDYGEKDGCQDSDAIKVSSLRRGKNTRDVLFTIRSALARSENQDRNLNGILGMATFHGRIPRGGRKVIDIVQEMRCEKGDEESCDILLLSHLWTLYSFALHASKTQKTSINFRKRNAKFAKYVKNMMKRVVGLESDQGGSDEEYEELLQERLAALTGKPTHRSLMERLKRLKD